MAASAQRPPKAKPQGQTLRQKDWQALTRRSVPHWREAGLRVRPPKGQTGGRQQRRRTANLSGKADSEGEPTVIGGVVALGSPCHVRRCPQQTPLHALHVEQGAQHGAFAGYSIAGELPRRHHCRAPPLPHVCGPVRCLAHGPTAPARRRRRACTRIAGADGHRRPGRQQAALRPSSPTRTAACSTT